MISPSPSMIMFCYTHIRLSLFRSIVFFCLTLVGFCNQDLSLPSSTLRRPSWTVASVLKTVSFVERGRQCYSLCILINNIQWGGIVNVACVIAKASRMKFSFGLLLWFLCGSGTFGLWDHHCHHKNCYHHSHCALLANLVYLLFRSSYIVEQRHRSTFSLYWAREHMRIVEFGGTLSYSFITTGKVIWSNCLMLNYVQPISSQLFLALKYFLL